MNPVTKLIDAKGLGKKAAKKTLTKAERDENLKKFLELSVVKERMFHGSTNPDIVQFKTGKTLLEERYPQIKVKPFEHSQGRDAAFLTPDPQFASRYSGEEWAVTPGTAPTVYPVRVQAQNPWDYDNPEHIEAAINLYKEKFPLIRDSSGAVPSFDANRHRYLEEVLRELPSRNDNWSGIERPDIQEVIRDLGHDSFFVKERGVKNLGVYDPKKIKSDLGNQGTYDVTDPDITKAAGGLIRMQGGGDIEKPVLADEVAGYMDRLNSRDSGSPLSQFKEDFTILPEEDTYELTRGLDRIYTPKIGEYIADVQSPAELLGRIKDLDPEYVDALTSGLSELISQTQPGGPNSFDSVPKYHGSDPLDKLNRQEIDEAAWQVYENPALASTFVNVLQNPLAYTMTESAVDQPRDIKAEVWNEGFPKWKEEVLGAPADIQPLVNQPEDEELGSSYQGLMPLLQAKFGNKGQQQYRSGGAVHMQDGGDPTQMFNFNPMAAKAAKQKQMRESTPETPLGALSRGFATGLFGSTEEQVPYTGSIMEGSSQRQQSQANLREIGRNVGALTDIGGMVTPFVKPATQAVTRGATALGRAGLEQVDRAMFGEGPLGNALSMAAPLNVNAPVSRLGFYNPIEEMATTLQRKQGPGQAFLNEFTKAGISKQRLEDAGLTQKLAASPNVTREEVQAMTKGTMPDVEEVVLSRSVIPPYMKGFANLHMPNLDVNDYRQINQLRKIADERYKKALAENDLDAAEFAMKAEEDINKFSRTHSYGTKPGERLTEFHEYQEPGGKNYREILLKVPVKRVSEEEARVILNARPEDKLSAYDIDFASRKANPGFRSAHWMDPNVISHIRMNDRVDADNKNVLFIEELQSDWAQEGRKKGFGKDVPQGPFVKNTNEWVDLSLKNIIKRAVDEGYDRVAFIDGYKSFLRFPQDAKGESTEAGMRKFYDEIIPGRLKALVGKDNVRTIPGITQQRPLDVSLQGDRYYVVDADTDIAIPDHPGFRSLERAEQYLDELYSKSKSMDQIGFDITPEIREKFSQPIPYKHGGVVKMAAGGAKKLKRASEAIAKFQDPQATKIQEWQWRPLAEVNKQLNLAEVPDYIQRGYGDFMIEQGKRAAAGNLGVRDLIKAYGITQSSIGRGGLSYDTATKAGLKVPKTEGLVRPEGAFAEWLGSKQGQKFLDDAERGVVNEKALDDIRAKFAPFGKANQLTEQLRYGVNNMSTLVPQMQQALVGSADEYRDWAESIKGIAGAKSGFIGSMLGRGDLPTLDARQLNLHSLESHVAPQTMMQRGKGLGAREAVDRLAARQSALGLDIDPSLDPYYQHLAHHAVWDKVADEKTTHEDLMRALRGYKEGGEPDTDAMRLEMMRKSWRSK